LKQTAYLLKSRPTAVNLLEALSRIESAAKDTVQAESDARNLAEVVINVCISVWDDDRERNVQMGDFGADWILNKLHQEGSIQADTKINVLTVSHELWLALAARPDRPCAAGLQHGLIGYFCRHDQALDPLASTLTDLTPERHMGLLSA
jgi:hypothetical protein